METTPTEQTQETVQNAEQKPKSNKTLKITGIVILVILLLAAATAAWLYYSPSSSFKTKILGKLSYPVKIVNGKTITYKEVARRYEIAKKGNPSIGNLSSPDVGGKIVDSIVESNELDMIAQKYNTQVSGQDLDSLYNRVADTTTGGDKNALAQMLDKMGVTSDEFKQDILRPQAIVTNLAVWYNGQRSLNEDSYKKMDTIQQNLNQGQKFEDLAKTYSEDPSSKDLEGDMGEIDPKAILPELSGPISSMKAGDVKLIVSRYGLHLIKVDSKNDQTGTYHIKQIFVQSGQNFQNWYNDQKNAYHVTTLVKHF